MDMKTINYNLPVGDLSQKLYSPVNWREEEDEWEDKMHASYWEWHKRINNNPDEYLPSSRYAMENNKVLVDVVAYQLALGFDSRRGKMNLFVKKLVALTQRIVIKDTNWRNKLIKLQLQHLANERADYDVICKAGNPFIAKGRKSSTTEEQIIKCLRDKNMPACYFEFFIPDCREDNIKSIHLINTYTGVPLVHFDATMPIDAIDYKNKRMFSLNSPERLASLFSQQSFKSHIDNIRSGKDYRNDYIYLKIPRELTPDEVKKSVRSLPSEMLRKTLSPIDTKRGRKLIPNFPILIIVQECSERGMDDERIADEATRRLKLDAQLTGRDITENYKKSLDSLLR